MGLLRRKRDFAPVDMLVLEVGVLMERTAERAAAGVGRPGSTPGYRVIADGRRVVVYRLEDKSMSDFESRQRDFAARIGSLLTETFGRGRIKPVRYEGIYHGFEVIVV